ncbi:MAG: hypothetical protein ABIO49_14900 [Dokdonella sp.]
MPIEKDPVERPDSLSGLTVEQVQVVLDALSLPTKIKIEERKVREAEKAKQGVVVFIPFIG